MNGDESSYVSGQLRPRLAPVARLFRLCAFFRFIHAVGNEGFAEGSFNVIGVWFFAIQLGFLRRSGSVGSSGVRYRMPDTCTS